MTFIFVMGCGHTGSSILARVLGSHPDVYFIDYESGAFLANRFFETQQILDKFSADATSMKCQFILEKTPRHIWHVDYIMSLVPTSKIIITFRNGFHVVASLIKRGYEIDQALTRYTDDTLLSLRQLDNPRVMPVKYEDFISQPMETVDKVFQWIGVKSIKNALQFHEVPINWNKFQFSREKNIDFDHDRKRQIQMNSPLNQEIKTWREQLSAKQIGDIKFAFAERPNLRLAMQHLGYTDDAET